MGNFLESLSEWIKQTVKAAVKELLDLERAKEGNGLINIKETCEFLGISTSCFEEHYRYKAGFPKELPAKRWSRYAIIEWLKRQY